MILIELCTECHILARKLKYMDVKTLETTDFRLLTFYLLMADVTNAVFQSFRELQSTISYFSYVTCCCNVPIQAR
jgi:hypothetical protein